MAPLQLLSCPQFPSLMAELRSYFLSLTAVEEVLNPEAVQTLCCINYSLVLCPPQQRSVVWEGSKDKSAAHWEQEDLSCLPRSPPVCEGSWYQLLDLPCSSPSWLSPTVLFVRELLRHRSVLFSKPHCELCAS